MKELFNKTTLKIWLLGIIGIIVLPLLLKFSLYDLFNNKFDFLKHFDFSETGQIGDTIGGITGPFINLLGAILVYVAFKEQADANKNQKKTNKNQKKTNKNQKKINKENDAEKVSNNIENQLSKLELYVLEDKFKLLDTASRYENIIKLFKKNQDRPEQVEYQLDIRELSKVVYLQSKISYIIDELYSSEENNKNYERQKNKIIYLMFLIDSSGYKKIVDLIKGFDNLKKDFHSKTKVLEDIIIESHKMILNKLDSL